MQVVKMNLCNVKSFIWTLEPIYPLYLIRNHNSPNASNNTHIYIYEETHPFIDLRRTFIAD